MGRSRGLRGTRRVWIGLGVVWLKYGFAEGVPWSWAGALLFAAFAVGLWHGRRKYRTASAENGHLPE